MQINTPILFLNEFFKKRNLSGSDGRALYKYKISNGRYNLLKSVLIENWDDTEECHACFVLYAAEYLRSEFDESHLGWEKLFSNIDKPYLNQPSERSEITNKGLQYWGREVYKNRNREYIETLRFESGLSNAALAEDKKIASLIKEVYQLLDSYHIPLEELLESIAAKAAIHRLAQVLQQPTFYELVAEISNQLVNFKLRYNLAEAKSPVDQLTLEAPGWKTDLPIKVDDDSEAARFIDKLLCEVVSLKKLEKPALDIFYQLSEQGEGFAIKTVLSIADGAHSAEAMMINEEELQPLPVLFNLFITTDQSIRTVTSGLSKTNIGKVSCKSLKDLVLPENIHAQNWSLFYGNANNTIETSFLNLESFVLPKDVPLVFVYDEAQAKWIFKGAGSLSIKQEEARLLIPEKLVGRFEGKAEFLGNVVSQYKVYRIAEDVQFIDLEDETAYRIKLGVAKEEMLKLVFQHRKRPSGFDFDREQDVFLGLPSIVSVSLHTGFPIPFKGEVQFRSLKDGTWLPISEFKEYGLARLRCVGKGGTVIVKKTVGILPADFQIQVVDRPLAIEVKSRESLTVYSGKNYLKASTMGPGNAWTFEVVKSSTFSEEMVTLQVAGTNGTPLNLHVLNPQFSEIFVNPSGEILKHAELDINSLHGCRLIISNQSANATTKKLELVLDDIKNKWQSPVKISRKIKLAPYETIRYPLYKFKYDFDMLFSFTEYNQAKVKLSLEAGHRAIFLVQYQASLQFRDGFLLLDNNESLQGFELFAFRLDKRFRKEDIIKLRLTDDGCACDPDESIAENGLWLIYASVDSPYAIRPTVHFKGIDRINGLFLDIDNLHESSGTDYETRKQNLKSFLERVAFDYDHDCWAQLYELFQALKHLPLNVLDIWKCLVKVPEALITYLFSFSSDIDVLNKLTDSYNIRWRLIPLKTWQKGFEIAKNHLVSQGQETLLSYFIEQKLKIINSLGMPEISEILEGQATKVSASQCAYFLNRYINGEEGNPGVRGRQAENVRWEENASDLIIDKFKKLPLDLRKMLPLGIPRFQQSVIYLPLVIAYHSVIGDYIKASELDGITRLGITVNIDFDQTYFEEVYALLLNYCLQHYSNTQNGTPHV